MLAAVLSAGALLAVTVGSVAAHSHTANGQLIANGQNHLAFVMQADGTFLACDTFTPLPGVGPAWYGLERRTMDLTRATPVEVTGAT